MSATIDSNITPQSSEKKSADKTADKTEDKHKFLLKHIVHHGIFSSSNSSYGVYVFLISIIIILCLCSYFVTKIDMLRDTWSTNTLNPIHVLLSGFIRPNPSEDNNLTHFEVIFKYIGRAFEELGMIVLNTAVSPILVVLQLLKEFIESINDKNSILGDLLAGISEFSADLFETVFNKLAEMTIPIQTMLAAISNAMRSLTGVIVTNIYMLMGAHMIVESVFKIIYKFVLILLISLTVAFFVFLAIVATGPWGLWALAPSAIISAIYILFAIPASILVKYLPVITGSKGGKICTGRPCKSMKKASSGTSCFSKNTPIQLYDGTYKPISEIKSRDKLRDGGIVTAVFVSLTGKNKVVKMHHDELGCDFYITEKHPVLHKDKWIQISDHPYIIKNTSETDSEFSDNYVYCLSTTTKTIIINNYYFSDWDELDETDYILINNNIQKYVPSGIDIRKEKQNLHKYFEGGFVSVTEIDLVNGLKEKISKIKIGDILAENVIVTGIVKITPPKQLTTVKINNLYVTGNHNNIYSYKKNNENSANNESGNKNENSANNENRNWIFMIDSTLNCRTLKKNNLFSNNLLYHIVTDKGYFKISDTIIGDYNTCLDYLLEYN